VGGGKNFKVMREDDTMYITDKLIPMIIGNRDRRSNGQQLSNELMLQAVTYRNILDANYRKEEQKIVVQSLASLKKRIKPLEVDHDRFLHAVEDKRREILQYPGVSDVDKLHLAQSAANAEYTLEANGQKTVLNIDKIMKQKDLICIEANSLIDKKNDILKKLHSAFKYRLANYLRAVNSHSQRGKEIQVEMTAALKLMQHWNSSEVYSSAVTENELKETIKNGNEYIVHLDASRNREDVAQ